MSRPILKLPEAESEEAPVADPSAGTRRHWLRAFAAVRMETERRAGQLSAEDQVVQSMADASPTKWHRAHVTWFFEQFLLRPFNPSYRPFDERFSYLFNSYYVAAGPRHARPQRGLITRPGLAETTAYRAYVDAAVAALIDSAANGAPIFPIVEVGLHHEQQHQELLLTDILHAFAQNPTHPAYDTQWQWPQNRVLDDAADGHFEGVYTIGAEENGFSFDNERPAHRVFLEPVRVGRKLVTNGEWLEFMADGGYTKPHLWLSDGWAIVAAEGWNAPGYWQLIDGAWFSMTLGGLRAPLPTQ